MGDFGLLLGTMVGGAVVFGGVFLAWQSWQKRRIHQILDASPQCRFCQEEIESSDAACLNCGFAARWADHPDVAPHLKIYFDLCKALPLLDQAHLMLVEVEAGYAKDVHGQTAAAANLQADAMPYILSTLAAYDTLKMPEMFVSEVSLGEYLGDMVSLVDSNTSSAVKLVSQTLDSGASGLEDNLEQQMAFLAGCHEAHKKAGASMIGAMQRLEEES